MVCRAEIDAGPLIARLDGLGATIKAIPLFVRVPPSDEGRALTAALDRLHRYQWLAATSVNGVRAIVEGLAGRSLPAHVRVAAVGRGTAGAFAEAGISVDLVPSTATAADLAEAFGPANGDERVLAALAELATPDLVQGLCRRGYGVDRVDAYQMEPCAVDPTRIVGADAALLTSPSIVERFVAVAPAGAVPPTVVCIGPRTAGRAADLGLANVVVADPHNDDGLVDALLKTL